MMNVVDFDFLRCACGGIIGMYDRNSFSCDACGRPVKLHEGDYSELKINDKTGWVFPVKYKIP